MQVVPWAEARLSWEEARKEGHPRDFLVLHTNTPLATKGVQRLTEEFAMELEVKHKLDFAMQINRDMTGALC